MAHIQFLKNEAGKVEGLAYAGFETFKGSPYTSCARETSQNSRDAIAGNAPVSVSFDLLKINRADVPFAGELQHAIECGLIAPRDRKTKQYLERALATISAPIIKILVIADRNTTGLTGPTTDPDSVFTALVKGDGVTNKQDPTSAGSYGIGKNAAYAVSDLQTVIYSTCYLDGTTKKKKFAAQGRLRLISHADGKKLFSAEGYWGNANFSAIEDKSQVPSWVWRDEIGTSIYAVGFKEQENWASRMTLSLLTNFFLAIDRKEIEFLVGGSAPLNQASLDSVLYSTELRQIAKEDDQLDELERARRLLDCTRSDAAAQHTLTVRGLGDFTLHLLVGAGLPREVHVLRNGIYITDNFAKFGQPMRRFPGTREFIAVLEPARTESGRKPSALLKQLENPAHVAFEPQRIVDELELKRARDQIKDLIAQVRKVIHSAAKIEDIDRSQLDELSHLFADPTSTRDTGIADGEKDPEGFRYGAARNGSRARSSGTDGQGQGRGRRGNEPGAGIRLPGKGTGVISHHPPRHQQAVPLEEIRSILPEPNDPRKRIIFFTPRGDGAIELAVEAVGLSGDVQLTVANSSAGTTTHGHIQTTVKAGQRTSVNLIFTEPFAGPIELTSVPLKPDAPGRNN